MLNWIICKKNCFWHLTVCKLFEIELFLRIKMNFGIKEEEEEEEKEEED